MLYHLFPFSYSKNYGLRLRRTLDQSFGTDVAILRAFIKEELMLLLNMSGFALINTYTKSAYTWPNPFYLVRRIG